MNSTPASAFVRWWVFLLTKPAGGRSAGNLKMCIAYLIGPKGVIARKSVDDATNSRELLKFAENTIGHVNVDVWPLYSSPSDADYIVIGADRFGTEEFYSEHFPDEIRKLLVFDPEFGGYRLNDCNELFL